MRKQNHLSTIIRSLLLLLLTSTLFHACTDEEVLTTTSVREGIPVEVKLALSIPDMPKVNTRLSDADEQAIKDIYVLVFDAAGNKKTGALYSGGEIETNQGRGTLTLKTTSGESRIYAVANAATTDLNGGPAIQDQLEAVRTLSDLMKATATLGDQTLITRVQASLTMSGAFKGRTTTAQAEGYCLIPETSEATLDGIIPLTRLDSRITFKITTGKAVTHFEPTSWQVVHVPKRSTLMAQSKNILSTDGESPSTADYVDSNVSNQFGATGDNAKVRTFDFYMMESLKKAQAYNGASIDPNPSTDAAKKAEYAKREEEIKDNKQNTGIYKYVEKYATYVEIKGSLEITMPDADYEKRIANVTLVIHLGGGIADPANFNSERNTKYTYNVLINNVDDIVVEVTEDKENRPGMEGDVVDSKTDVRTLDAHYNCFVMGFSYNDVSDSHGNEALKFVANTPFGQTTDETPEKERTDYQWVHFKANTGNASSKLELYKKDDSLIDLYGLAASVRTQYNKDNKKNKEKKYYYTVFVDEYYYTTPPNGQQWGSDPSTYWRHFANMSNRYVMLVYAPTYSADGESSYATAQYMLSQRSIQTYYSTEASTALGMEHANETGAAIWKTPGEDVSADPEKGLHNTWSYLKKNTSWETHTTRTVPDEKNNTFQTKNEAIALARCLARNRDENGDGTIDASEVKWYVPTSQQLMGMYLGAQSLPSPLFDSNITGFKKENRGLYHYMTSDAKRFWSDEGGSIGEIDDGWGTGTTRNFRCVRNLGIDVTSISEKTPTAQKPYTYVDDTQTFDLRVLTPQNKRGAITRGEIYLHDNFSDGNKPSNAFQMAEETIGGEAGEKTITVYTATDKKYKVGMTTWNKIIRSYWYKRMGNNWNSYNLLTTDNDLSYCKDYSENKNLSDKGTWRAPNQREVMLMYMNNPEDVKGDGGSYTRTYWKYDNDRHFGVDGGNLFLDGDGQKFTTSTIRCVRDVVIKQP